ncbi:MAG: hypothetical protein GF329_13890 [Candidatus Lokiarchaeota archaeon]|nr:hypothetical protein [Candidatus Lokiarchaeota archaeon]
MASTNGVLKKVLNFEKILDKIRKNLDFDYVARKVLPKNIIDFIENLDYFKDKLKSKNVSDKEIIIINEVLNEMKLYIDNKFTDYIY